MTTATMPDGRPVPPPRADERAMLESWLEFHRSTLALKCSGLDDEQARRASVPPSPMTLLGLVRHMTEVERGWFQRVFAGLDVPWVYGESTETAGGFTVSSDHGLEDALTVWRAEVARCRELIATASLDDTGLLPESDAGYFGGSREVSLRWILIHMIEEYARHNGHADLIRERIDGTTGA
ncbi:DinB family protein [Streptomyces megasporus]|uniref:DinB family protein n=1 Tax=Streptomyces megasporus TaxID=44060 RepID=UPI0004E1015D|nr:DinB family protein [Streptomyces megasporus]